MNLALDIMGWIGMVFAILMFCPQTWKVIRTKDTTTLSKTAFSINAFGASMWVIFCSILSVYQGFACNAAILVMMNAIFWYMFKDKKLYFFIALAYSAIILVLSFVFIFVIDKNSIPIETNYVFIVGAGGAVGFAFVPQVIKIFVKKDFKSYSLISSALIFACNVFWGAYWIGTIINADNSKLPLMSLSLSFTLLQGIVQIPILGLYLYRKQKGLLNVTK